MTDPINVRVARFIGWTDVQKLEGREKWVGIPPCHHTPGTLITSCTACGGSGFSSKYAPIPPFGESSPAGWACMGPLIERFEITLEQGPWCAYSYYTAECVEGGGPAPLAAIVACVLALAERIGIEEDARPKPGQSESTFTEGR